MAQLDDDAERAAFSTYHILVHMADFPNISLDQISKFVCVYNYM